MLVLLIQVDGKIPNLALMKLARYHKLQGDEVILIRGMKISSRLFIPDKVYISCVFEKNRQTVLKLAKQFPHSDVSIGGSGIDLVNKLPEEMEHLMPDYDLFGCDYSIGFTSRGCIRACPFCIVPKKEGSIKAVADIYEFWDKRHKHIVLCDNNILALHDHFQKIAMQIKNENLTVDFNQGLDIRLINDENAGILKGLRVKPEYRFAWDDIKLEEKVRSGIDILRSNGINRARWYVIVGYNSTIEDDLYRLNVLKELNQRAYVMRYQWGDKIYSDMAAWAQAPGMFMKKTFDEFRQIRNHRR